MKACAKHIFSTEPGFGFDDKLTGYKRAKCVDCGALRWWHKGKPIRAPFDPGEIVRPTFELRAGDAATLRQRVRVVACVPATGALSGWLVYATTKLTGKLPEETDALEVNAIDAHWFIAEAMR